MLNSKTLCHNGGIFFLHVHKKSRSNFFCYCMLNIEKKCFIINLHKLSESAYYISSKFKHALGI